LPAVHACIKILKAVVSSTTYVMSTTQASPPLYNPLVQNQGKQHYSGHFEEP
jgi:hypothetical protein